MYNDGIREDASEREINKNIATIFFRNEKAIREKNDISQAAMGEYIGCTDVAVSNWELGKTTPRNLDEIIKTVSELFDLDPAALVTEDFADRYDPKILQETNKAVIEEVEQELNKNVVESDRDIALRYFTTRYEMAIKRYEECEKELYKLAEQIEAYKQGLKVFDISIDE